MKATEDRMRALGLLTPMSVLQLDDQEIELSSTESWGRERLEQFVVGSHFLMREDGYV